MHWLTLHRLTRPRHLALTFVVLLATGGIAAAVATPEDPEGTFQTPAYMVGDAGTYAPAVDGVAAGDTTFSFELIDQRPMWNETGHGSWALEVLYEDGRAQDRTRSLYVDAQTFGSIASRTRMQDEHTIGEGADEADRVVIADDTQLGDFAPVPCQLAHAGSQALPADGTPVPITASCWNGPRPDDPEPWFAMVTAFTDESPRTWTVVYHRGDLDDERGAELRYWFQEDTPVPVRIDYLRPTSVNGQDREGLVLTGFARGETPVVEQGVADLPAIPMVPHDHILVPGDELDHPFTLRDAFDHALADAGNNSLAAFMDTHPDAYVGSAHLEVFDLEDRRSHRWTFVTTDGQDAIGIALSKNTYTPVSPAADDLLAPLGLGRSGYAQPPYHYEDTEEAERSSFPPPGQVPEKVPQAAGLLATWAIVAPPGNPDADPTWGYQVQTCADGPCPVPSLWATAGRVYYYREEVGTAQAGTIDAWDSSGASFLDDQVFAFGTSQQIDASGAARLPVPDVPEDVPSYEDVIPPDEAALRTVAAIAGGSILAGLLFWLSPLLKTGAVGLYSRVKGSVLLQHPLRRRIHEIIEEQPGIHYQQLLRAVKGPNGTIEHHVHKLVEGGLLVAQTSGGFTCYFVRGKLDRRVMMALHAVKADAARKVLDVIRGHPDIAPSAVADQVGIKPATVTHHTKRLAAAGLIERERAGRSVRLRATALVSMLP